MHWQDLVLTLAALFMGLGLIEALKSSVKPPMKHSIAFAIGSMFIIIVDLSLSYWLVAFIMLLQTIAWSVLAEQKLKCEAIARVKNGTASAVGDALKNREDVFTKVF